MENFSEYLIPGSVGTAVALGLIKLLSKVIDWLMKRDEIGEREDKDYREHFIKDFYKMKSEITSLRNKNEEKDKEYDELQSRYYNQVTKNAKQEIRIKQLEKEVEQLKKKINKLENDR